MSKKTYTLISTFESKSNPGKFYEVKRDEYGNFSCNCPAWIFKANRERTCRHIKEVEER